MSAPLIDYTFAFQKRNKYAFVEVRVDIDNIMGHIMSVGHPKVDYFVLFFFFNDSQNLTINKRCPIWITMNFVN